jgi:hydroxymethylpyrimidine pyrophosphatase-like HAD family hydrolase
LRDWKSAGGRVILVTGREIGPLEQDFESLGLCDLVVAENGAVLFRPSSGEVRLLAPRAPQGLVDALHRQNVSPLSMGHCIVATLQVHEKAVRSAIREFRLSHQVILNKESLMVLPAGVDKGSGLALALQELKASPADCAAVGDAENDLPLFNAADLSCAVANAIPSVMGHASVRLKRPEGEGVSELIQGLIHDKFARHRVA